MKRLLGAWARTMWYRRRRAGRRPRSFRSRSFAQCGGSVEAALQLGLGWDQLAHAEAPRFDLSSVRTRARVGGWQGGRRGGAIDRFGVHGAFVRTTDKVSTPTLMQAPGYPQEAILTRRAVRSFLPTPVPRASVEELLALPPAAERIEHPALEVRVVGGVATG